MLPWPDETFHDLLVHARMLEEHEKQFAASAERRSGKTGRKSTRVEDPNLKEQTGVESSSSKNNNERGGSTLPTKATERHYSSDDTSKGTVH